MKNRIAPIVSLGDGGDVQASHPSNECDGLSVERCAAMLTELAAVSLSEYVSSIGLMLALRVLMDDD